MDAFIDHRDLNIRLYSKYRGIYIALPYINYCMTTQQIAESLVSYCEKGDFETAQKELYADDAVSIEPHPSSQFEKETKGLDAIIEKGHKWEASVKESHSITVSEPLVAGNAFAFILQMDLTMVEHGRINMTELCVYRVKDGKIISEQFFM